MRGLGRSAVSDDLGVEQNQVCVVTRLDQATLADPNLFGGKRSHLPNPLFETDNITLTNVMTEKPGKGAKASRMSTGKFTVTANHGMWPGHDGLDVGFVHGQKRSFPIIRIDIAP